MDFFLRITINFVWQMVPDLQDRVFFNYSTVKLLVRLAIKDTLMQELINLRVRVRNIKSNKNRALRVAADKMKVLVNLFNHGLMETLH